MLSLKEWWLLAGLAVAVCIGALGLYVYDRIGRVRVTQQVESARVQEVFALNEPDHEEVIEESPGVPQVPPATSAQPAPAVPVLEAQVTICAAGGVAVPGVYAFVQGARVQDLINAAGGSVVNADLSDINLAAELVDGSTLTIPTETTGTMEDGTLVVHGGTGGAVSNIPQYTISGWQSGARAAISPSPDRVPAPASSATPPASPGSGLVDLNRATSDQLDALPGIGPKLSAEIIRYRTGHPFKSIDDLGNVPGIGPKRLETLRPLVTAGGS